MYYYSETEPGVKTRFFLVAHVDHAEDPFIFSNFKKRNHKNILLSHVKATF